MIVAVAAGGIADGSRPDIHGAHQTRFGVVENVAVIHPGSRAIELDEKAPRGFGGDVDGVFPGARADRNAFFIHFLEEKPVKVNRAPRSPCW